MAAWLDDQDIAECWVGVDPACLSGRRLFVLGASGCLGGALVEAVLAKRDAGLDVEVLVAGRSREKLVRRFGGRLDADAVFEWDASNGRASELPNWDFAVHAASDASPKAYLARPVDTLQANANGIAQLLASAPAHGRMLFISSGEIYGSPDAGNVPTPEEYLAPSDTLDERACYREGKRFAESLLWSGRRQIGVRGVISRPVHVFGPGLRPDDGRVICDFLQKAIGGESICMLSDGSARRSFCYVSDATRLHLQLLLHADDGTVCNVGRDDTECSIAELAQLIDEHFSGHGVQLSQASHTAGSPARSCPDMSRARDLFAYEPQVDLLSGIERLAAWWQREGLL